MKTVKTQTNRPRQNVAQSARPKGKTQEFVFDLVGRIKFNEDIRRFLNLIDHNVLAQLEIIEKKIAKMGYDSRTPFALLPKSIQEEVFALELTKDDFSKPDNNVSRSSYLKAWRIPDYYQHGIDDPATMSGKEIFVEAPSIPAPLIRKLKSLGYGFPESTEPPNEIEYFVDLKRELEDTVYPAIVAARGGELDSDSEEFDALQEWIVGQLQLVGLLEAEPNCKVKLVGATEVPTRIRGKAIFQRGLTYEQAMTTEILEFWQTEGLAKVRQCPECKRFFLRGTERRIGCSDACKMKSRRKGRNLSKR